jgi:acetyltransferase-like isoleucine patch superfamily enzyme
MGNKSYKIQDSIVGEKKSKIKRYQELVIGNEKLSDLIKYELIYLFFSWIPGALGVLLRGKTFPLILGSVGKGCVFGRNIVFRHAGKIKLGSKVILDDNLLIDAKGEDNEGITLKDEVFIGRNSILSCKGGNIELDDRANLGANCYIFSSNRVKLGKDVIVAAYTYFVGGGNYNLDQLNVPINLQYDYEGKGGLEISDNVWVGAHCVILDGVKIGKGSVVAAGAIVSKTVEEMSIVGGVPAKIIKSRIH